MGEQGGDTPEKVKKLTGCGVWVILNISNCLINTQERDGMAGKGKTRRTRNVIVTSVALSRSAYEVANSIPYGLRSGIISALLEEWGKNGGIEALVRLETEKVRRAQLDTERLAEEFRELRERLLPEGKREREKGRRKMAEE